MRRSMRFSPGLKLMTTRVAASVRAATATANSRRPLRGFFIAALEGGLHQLDQLGSVMASAPGSFTASTALAAGAVLHGATVTRRDFMGKCSRERSETVKKRSLATT